MIRRAAFAFALVGCSIAAKQPSSLDADRKTLCKSAISSGLTLATAFPLREPITLRTDPACRDVIPDVEYALVRRGLLAAREGEGTVVNVAFAHSQLGCDPPAPRRIPYQPEGEDAGGICGIDPSACPIFEFRDEPKSRAEALLDMDTSCSAASEGRCEELSVFVTRNGHDGATIETLRCEHGHWTQRAGQWISRDSVVMPHEW